MSEQARQRPSAARAPRQEANTTTADGRKEIRGSRFDKDIFHESADASRRRIGGAEREGGA